MSDNSQEILNHAIHNHNALKLLDKKPDFLDWVVTMAFYSSLFYIKYKIFPLPVKTDKGQRYVVKNFDEYYRHNKHLAPNKHELLINLAYEHCSEIAVDYNQLFDMCMNARYHEYKVDRKISNEAKGYLEKIKSFCGEKEDK